MFCVTLKTSVAFVLPPPTAKALKSNTPNGGIQLKKRNEGEMNANPSCFLEVDFQTFVSALEPI